MYHQHIYMAQIGNCNGVKPCIYIKGLGYFNNVSTCIFGIGWESFCQKPRYHQNINLFFLCVTREVDQKKRLNMAEKKPSTILTLERDVIVTIIS